MLRTYTNFYLWNIDAIVKYGYRVEMIDKDLCVDCLDCEFKLMNIKNCSHIAYNYKTKKPTGFFSFVSGIGIIKI